MSILRTNEIQNTSGKVILSNTGGLLQVSEAHSSSAYTINSTEIKVIEASITTKSANSNILVMLTVGRSAQNSDTDPALAMAYRSGSSAASASSYTSLHGSSYSRQTISTIGSFWAQDTVDPGGGTWNGQYGIYGVQFYKFHAPNVAAGTTLYYALFGGSDGTFYLGRSVSGSTDNGYDTSIVLMEISA